MLGFTGGLAFVTLGALLGCLLSAWIWRDLPTSTPDSSRSYRFFHGAWVALKGARASPTQLREMCRFVGTENSTAARIVVLFVIMVGVAGFLTLGAVIGFVAINKGGPFAKGVGTSALVSALVLASVGGIYLWKKRWKVVFVSALVLASVAGMHLWKKR
jgi:hypothetical protein